MLCPKCGQKCLKNETVCPFCGAELPTEETVDETVVTEAAAAEEETPAPEENTTDALGAFADSIRVEDTSVLPEEEEVEKIPAPKKPMSLTAVAVIALVLALVVAVAGWFLAGKPAESTLPGTSVMESEELTYPYGYDYLNNDLSQFVTLGAYKGLDIDVTTNTEVTDAEIQEYVAYMLEQFSSYAEVDRAAALGDRVSIDYSGSLDGVKFDGGTGSTDSLVLGSGGMIPGFEDGIVGMTVGETKVVDATFPEDYKNNPDLAGKTAQFEITLKKVSEEVPAEYTDAFVSENFNMESTAAFEAAIRSQMEEQKLEEAASEKTSAVLSAAVENATFKGYPEGLVEDFMIQQIQYLQQVLPYYYGMDYDTFMTESGYEDAVAFEQEMVRPRAEEMIRQELILFAIAEVEGLTATDEEYQAELAYLMSAYGVEDTDALCEAAEATPEQVEHTLRSSVVYDKALDFLTENN